MTADGRAGPVRLAVLGDSIAYGIGADRAEDTLAPRLRADLAQVGVEALTQVFAAPGARSADLGRQAERGAAWRPDVAVVIIGANDLTHQVPVASAAADLRTALRELRGAGARVVVAPAPDLSVVPRVPRSMRNAVRVLSAELRAAQVEVTLAEGGVVADAEAATSTSFADDVSLFSRDGFHPSSRGYARIAAQLVPLVRASVLDVPA